MEKAASPFRLFVHIGAGKTGSSSIQQTLKANRDALFEKGIAYWGLMLELSKYKKFTWQRAAGSREFHLMKESEAKRQLKHVLLQSIEAQGDSECCSAIWSNEWMFKRSGVVIDALRAVAEEGVDVVIVAYVRRPDAWLRSAYIQWGIKHKTYRGRIKTFKEWIASGRGRPTFYSDLTPWLTAFPADVRVRNVDALEDVALDFLQVIGVPSTGVKVIRANETPSPEELYARALFNNAHDDKVPVQRFDKLIAGSQSSKELSPETFVSRMMPTLKDLEAEASLYDGDQQKLNDLLESQGQPRIYSEGLPETPVSPDPQKLSALLSRVVVMQAEKVATLERQLDSRGMKHEEASGARRRTTRGKSIVEGECPVFAISTGRSGSTLVQRLLNCHPDLVVWGEHFGFLNGLAQSYAQMSNPSQKNYPRRTKDNRAYKAVIPTLRDPSAAIEWVNPWSLEEFRDHIREFISGYFSAHLSEGQRWGFKEIRYNNIYMLNMLSDVYTGGKFVFIRRDPIEVTRSKIYAFLKEDAWQAYSEVERRKKIENLLRDVESHYKLYDDFVSKMPSSCLVVNYEDVISRPRETIFGMLDHVNLNAEKYDWSLSEQVLGSIITTTKRDTALTGLIADVKEGMTP